MVNFYRKFLIGAAKVLAPLTDALNGPKKTISWCPLMATARLRIFSHQFLSWFILSPMCQSPLLSTPHWSCSATATFGEILVSSSILLQETV